jgi:pimeloyl-ACP methyl ester carboxylesterase
VALTFVLVPGAGGNAGYWQRVVPLLVEAGRDVVAVDLPNWAGATLSDQADAIVTAAAGRGEVVLVAQSMGGFSAPLACGRLPVAELVLVNAMIPDPGETAGDWWDNTGQPAALRQNDVHAGRDPDAGFDPHTYFFHDLSPDVVRLLIDAGDEEPADSLFGQPFPLAGWPDVPTRVLSGRDDRLFPLEFQRRVARERLGLAVTELDGGHLLALSRPEALVAQLLPRP